MAPERRRYTKHQKAEVVAYASEHGLAAAARAFDVKADTVRRWCDLASVTPADGRRRNKTEGLVSKINEGTIGAAAARSDRVADTQKALTDVAGKQSVIVSTHQIAALTAITRVNDAYARLADAEEAIPADIPTAPDERIAAGRAVRRRDEIEGRLDREIERARKIAIATGIHVDKILRLAGETTDTAAQGAAAVDIQRSVAGLLADPEFRQAAIDRVTRASIHSINGGKASA